MRQGFTRVESASRETKCVSSCRRFAAIGAKLASAEKPETAHAFCLIAAASARPYDPRMSTLTLRINGKTLSADVDPNTPLLWVLRDSLGLVGTKFGCGMALCGACTVLAD